MGRVQSRPRRHHARDRGRGAKARWWPRRARGGAAAAERAAESVAGRRARRPAAGPVLPRRAAGHGHAVGTVRCGRPVRVRPVGAVPGLPRPARRCRAPPARARRLGPRRVCVPHAARCPGGSSHGDAGGWIQGQKHGAVTGVQAAARRAALGAGQDHARPAGRRRAEPARLRPSPPTRSNARASRHQAAQPGAPAIPRR